MLTDPFLSQLLSIKNQNYRDNRLIYWSVINHENGTVQNFNVKFDALMYQKSLLHATLYFNWYSDYFPKFDYFIEPQESIKELKKQRALEIRQKYDYVRFWFSGGSDSTTALNAFLENNIHIDEIILYVLPDTNVSDPLQSSNRELMLSAIPYLKSNAEKLKNTKINQELLSFDEYKNILSGPDQLGYIPFLYSMDRGNFLYALDCHQYIWKKVIDRTPIENYCDVLGGSKPSVCKKNNEFYLYIVDSTISDLFLSHRAEDFFISKSDPKLFFKSAHLLKNYAIDKKLTSKQLIKLQQDTSLAPEYNKAIGRDKIFHPIAYYKTDRGNGIYCENINAKVQSYKHSLVVKNLSNDDNWRKLYITHQQSYKEMKNNFDWIWNLDNNNIPDPHLGYKGHVSQLYSLTKPGIYNNTDIFKNGFLNFNQEE